MNILKLVKWRDVIGGDFLDTFIKIEKSHYFDHIKGIPFEQTKKELLIKVSVEDFDLWVKKRYAMKCCGVEEDGRIQRWHGYYGYPRLINNELKFSHTVPHEPFKIEYISLSEFINMRQGLEQDNAEAEYYGIQKTVSDISEHVDIKVKQEHKRKDLWDDDPDFIKEIRENVA